MKRIRKHVSRMVYAKMILNIKWLSNLHLKQKCNKCNWNVENGGVLWNIFKDQLSEDFTRARERNFRFLSGLQETIFLQTVKIMRTLCIVLIKL